jgi:hypothetical protein
MLAKRSITIMLGHYYVASPLKIKSGKCHFLCLTIFSAYRCVYTPIIKDWLEQTFGLSQIIYLVVDRTCWKEKNLIMLSLVHEGRAIPIYFELLPKLGSSNFGEQKKFLSQVFPLLDKYKFVLLGDREFCSVALANWLRENNITFCLRLKKMKM